jgi:membrane protease subunit HflK
VMLDYKGSGNLLYLPLEKLLQGGAAQATEGGSAQPRAAPPEPAPDAAARSRETLRSRERGERQ